MEPTGEGTVALTSPTTGSAVGRTWLAPRRAEDRLPFTVPAPDRNRPALQAALRAVLIKAGVPLVPGDREAVRRIAEPGTLVVAPVVAWPSGRR
ncbi:hypothetical protein [Streptomyces chattanoogensis]|uniref:hypothetical protein n=1 Tax=Streptomyces chattanoogensis TaxID=66876 RepID=UPI00368E6FD4